MNHKFFVIISFALAFFGFASSLSAQTPPPRPGSRTTVRAAVLCTPAVPEDAQLLRYPYASGPLSLSQMADLQLRPKKLQYPFESFNFYRDAKACGGGTWRLEVIPAGELVLVGADGYVAYRASCGNRLVWAGKPVPPAAAAPKPPPSRMRQLWNWAWTTPTWLMWRASIEVLPNGGEVEIFAGDIHIKANGSSEVRVYR